ncbi:MAG: hypothetical protein ISR58_04175 [Anaerolineales bacterium]|nr:hypothetical protein [Chloroflexota bacterium]MBL6980370.1 hypothetical protein [Anaerolineales bacterium]
MIDKHTDDCDRSIFTLDQPIPYQLKIAGQVSENWTDWMEKIDIRIETERSGLTTTVLTGTFDQAALLGLIRRLYYLGFPLISVNCIQPGIQPQRN